MSRLGALTRAGRIPAALLGCLLAFATPLARAEAGRYSPFLDDLESVVRELHGGLPDPATRGEQVRRRALENALGALERTSTTFGEEVGIQADAVAALGGAWHRDAPMRAVVDHAQNLFLSRILARGRLLRRAALEDSSPEAKRARLKAVRFRFRYRAPTTAERTWKATARRLVRAVRELDAIADGLSLDRSVPIPRGSISLTMSTAAGDVELEFRIGDASWARGSDEFHLEAFALGPDPALADHWRFLTTGLVGPRAGAAYPQSGDPPVGPSYTNRGSVLLFQQAFLPARGPLEVGVREFFPDMSYDGNRLLLETWDPVAGTASGAFLFVMSPTLGLPAVVVKGRFDVAGGLEAE